MDRVEEIIEGIAHNNPRAIARAITLIENGDEQGVQLLSKLPAMSSRHYVIGITGPPGAGKSTLTDALATFYRSQGKRIGIIAVDPSSPLTGGAFLGDRVRMMKHATDPDVVIRSMATRGKLGGICGAAGATVRIMVSSGCEIVLVETVGVGQSEVDVIGIADHTLMVLAPGLGDDIQAMKAGILEVADFVAVNKADLPGAESLLMEMEEVFRDRKTETSLSGVTRVHATVAPDGKGIAELVSALDEMEKRNLQTGKKEQIRRKSSQKEILNWSLEILEKRLIDKIDKSDLSTGEDPRVQAEQFVNSILKSSDN